MAQNRSNVLPDGQASFLNGVHSHLHPRLVPVDSMSWAVNCRVRGGSLSPRPGYKKQQLTFPDSTTETRFETGGWFQGAGYYQGLQGTSLLLASIAGRLFQIDVSDSFRVSEVTPTDGTNFTRERQTTMTQAENWLLVQNGLDQPIIYEAGGVRRAGANEIRTMETMAYGNGRLWGSKNRGYVAGDLVGSSSGTSSLDRRDAVLKFTENTFLNEGGSFTTPVQAGPIRGMAFISNLDTTLGDGELIVFTPKSAFATTVPFDRTLWSQVQYPTQRYVSPAGALGPNTIVNINGDLYFRSRDGIRSLLFARRDFQDFGNTPISKEVERALAYDTPYNLRWGSGCLFDNRLLMTCAGYRTTQGIAHKGLVSLDFDPISSMLGQARPVYDGMWTGIDILQIVTGEFDEEERCFAFVLNSGSVELWEITRDDPSDYDGNSSQAITWFIETKSYSYGSPFELKRLDRFEVWLRDLKGTADLTLYHRPDDESAWHVFRTWQESAQSGACISDAGCVALGEFNPSYRTRRGGGSPSGECRVALPKIPLSYGYEHAFRLQGVGHVGVSAIRTMCYAMTEETETECVGTTATETSDTTCRLSDFV